GARGPARVRGPRDHPRPRRAGRRADGARSPARHAHGRRGGGRAGRRRPRPARRHGGQRGLPHPPHDRRRAPQKARSRVGAARAYPRAVTRRFSIVAAALLGLALFFAFVVEPHRDALHVLLRMEGPGGGLASIAALPRPDGERRDARALGGRARADRPRGGRGGVVVLLHGMHRLGIDEPRLVALAGALAETGLVVHTPELERLAAYRLEGAEASKLGEVVRAIASREDE